MKRLLLLCLGLCFTTAYADIAGGFEEIEQRDVQALREWINTKRQVTVNEKGGALAIAGEVRTEMQSTAETNNGIKQRGSGGTSGLPGIAYDIEVNVMMDYRTDRTWASIKLEFDNDAGVFNSTNNRIRIERAWMGARLIEQETLTFDTELGRRGLGTIFDSKLEGDSNFDGILFKYDQSFENVFDLYVHAGPFVVDERHDQYAYVGEVGMLNVADTGLYSKYLLIDWDTKHFSDSVRNKRFEFLVSQLLFGYKWIPQKLNKTVILYLAGLYNHAAEGLSITGGKKANWGSYIGLIIGELRRASDWSFEANYQVLAAQCVPDFDVSGIGVGNAARAGFYTARTDGSGIATTQKTAAGNANYRGFVLSLDYLLTNNITFQQRWQQSITLDKKIGPFRRYKQYEMEFIYGF